MDNLEYLKRLNDSFDELHDNLSTIRNYIGCFYQICVNKVSEYEPDKKFNDDLLSFVGDLFEKTLKGEIDTVDDSIIENKIKELLKKHNINIKDFAKRQGEQIANGTKLGIELHGVSAKFDFYVKAQKLLLINGLENATTCFEDFLSNIFTCWFTKYDDALSEKTITYKDLKQCSQITDIKNLFVLNEIESLLHKSVEEIFKTLQKNLGLSLNYFEKNKIRILEIFYRRNIFVHNKGFVNSTYLNNSKNPYELELSKYASIDVDYLYNVVSMLLLTAAEIVTEIISKFDLDGEKFEESKSSISNIAFCNYLCREDWEFALDFYTILLINSHLSATSVDMYKLNILLCKKKLNIIDVAMIKKEKWDNKKPILKMGYYALIEDFEKMETIIINYKTDEENGINSEDLKDWPIFIDYRTKEIEKYNALLKRLQEIEKDAR